MLQYLHAFHLARTLSKRQRVTRLLSIGASGLNMSRIAAPPTQRSVCTALSSGDLGSSDDLANQVLH